MGNARAQMLRILKCYANSILFCQTVGRPRRAVIHWPKTMFCISAPRIRLGNIPAIKKCKGKKYFIQF